MTFEDDFPFPKVGYASSLESKLKVFLNWVILSDVFFSRKKVQRRTFEVRISENY